jgi:hypothetical protein
VWGQVYALRPSYVQMERVVSRYELNPLVLSGEEVLHRLAQKMYKGNLYSAADRILADFRKGLLGPTTLEVPPPITPLPAYRPPAAATSKHDEDEDEEDMDMGEEEEEQQHEGEAEDEAQGGEEEGDEPKRKAPRILPERVIIGVGEFEGW